MPKRVHSISPVRSDKRAKMSNVVGDDGDEDMDQNEKRAAGPDPIHQGWSLAPGPPTYTHTVLPYIHEEKIFGYNDKNMTEHGYRMTSIYDPGVQTVTSDIQVGTGITNAGTLNPLDSKNSNNGICAYATYYTSLYKYYSVVGCRYSVTVENLGHERFMAHLLFHNETSPPYAASNHDMMLWKGVQSKVLYPKMIFADAVTVKSMEMKNGTNFDSASGTLENTTNGYETGNAQYQGRGIVHFSGEYRPGQYDQEVVLDTDSETWTDVNANPKLPEILNLRIKTYDNTSVAATSQSNVATLRSFNYIIRVQLTYLVEFKELKDAIRWPVTRNPIAVQVNEDPRGY